MKYSINVFVAVLLIISFYSCSEEKDIDTEKPTIDIDFDGAFPTSCDTLYIGEDSQIKLRFADNVELGSYSINIHNNFDHHSHSTELEECELEDIKTPTNPWEVTNTYSIPEGQKEYETDITFSVPSSNNNGTIEEGDYHFFISLTDKTGWSTQKGLSIKLLYR
nr:DUF4625 domain-containing protein [uncultured Carboxylicivirga sp.]